MKFQNSRINFSNIIVIFLFFLSCTKKDIVTPNLPTVTALDCSNASFSASATAGSSYTAVAKVPYIGGNIAAYLAGNAITSTNVTGLTVTLEAGILTLGTGNAVFNITGTPVTAGNASFSISFGGQSCVISLPVAISKSSISTLLCTADPTEGINGAVYNGTVTMAYTGGNGGTYDVSTALSTGVEGLKATLIAGLLKNGEGNLAYTISGTPTSVGNAIFNLSLGGIMCTVSVKIVAAPIVTGTPAKDTVSINYSASTVAINNPYQSEGVAITVTGTDVVVKSTNITKEIVYLLSGTASKGSFKLYSNFKYNLSLKNLNITNPIGPAINIQSGKKGTINIIGNTSNALADGATYSTSTEDQKGTFFSEGQLEFLGTGTLNISGNYKHGIVSDDYILVKESTINVKSAVKDGIHANDYFQLDNGIININSNGDGLVAEEGYIAINNGVININSVDDGLATTYSGTLTSITPYILIKGGKITITTTGDKGNAIVSKSYTAISTGDFVTLSVSGKGAKGIKTGGNFTLNAGTIKITTSGPAYYDTIDNDITAPAGINCDKNFVLSGGNLTIISQGAGAKGINIDGTAIINGGNTNISASGVKYTYNTANTSEAKAFKCDSDLIINNGEMTLSATDDGIKSGKSITVNDGLINVTKSYEGMESINITIAGGIVNLTASNDGINTSYGTVVGGTEQNDNSQLTITGGVLICSGSDAIDSNGNYTQKGGTVITNGNEDFDINGSFLINGGVLIGAEPSNGMTKPMGAASMQVGMFLKSSAQVATTSLLHIEDATGKDILTFKPKSNSAYFHFSNPNLAKSTAYKIFFGGAYTGGNFVGNTINWGLFTGGTYSNSSATLKASTTTSGSATVNTISF
jgi:trimeric autotransporter adhesin